MTWILLLVACAVGFLRGTKEGMIFIQDGDFRFKGSVYADESVKCHEWFQQYHTIGMLKDTMIVIYGALLWYTASSVIGMTTFPTIFASFVAIWESYELAYWFSREGVFIGPQERIVFTELIGEYVARGSWVYALHGLRVLMIIALSTGG